MRVVSGLYQLLIRLQLEREVRIGALGLRRFSRGWYVYTGSAHAGLYQRVSRHLRRRKRMHWHIDYLLERADAVEAFVLPGARISECCLHASLQHGTPIRGFGCSDCTCNSHLIHFQRRRKLQLLPWEDFCLSQDGANSAAQA